ncbi:hypothetical protein ES705_14812 [subsurface metagenome]
MKKLFFLLAMIALLGCEISKPIPNLIITNAYCDGYLTVINTGSRENIVSEIMLFNAEKELFLEIGRYQVRLFIDNGNDSIKQDRIMILDITDIHSRNKITFK